MLLIHFLLQQKLAKVRNWVALIETERERKGERSFHYLFVKMIQNCKSARTLLFIQERSLHSKLDLDPN